MLKHIAWGSWFPFNKSLSWFMHSRGVTVWWVVASCFIEHWRDVFRFSSATVLFTNHTHAHAKVQAVSRQWHELLCGPTLEQMRGSITSMGGQKLPCWDLNLNVFTCFKGNFLVKVFHIASSQLVGYFFSSGWKLTHPQCGRLTFGLGSTAFATVYILIGGDVVCCCSVTYLLRGWLTVAQFLQLLRLSWLRM